ncbi:MAG: histidine kinase [Spirochaetales bacterium]
MSNQTRGRSLNARQLKLFSAIAGLTVIVATMIGWLVFRQNALFSDHLETYLGIHRFRVALGTTERAMEQYQLDGAPEDLAEYEAHVSQLRQLVSFLNRTRTDELEDYFQLRAIRFALGAYLRTMEEAQRLRPSEPSAAFARFLRGARIKEYIDGYAEQLLQVRLEVGEAQVETLSRQARLVAALSASVLALLIAAMMLFALLFSRTVTRPIVRLAYTAHEMAGGNLNTPIIEVSSRDEIQTLAEAFATMQENISRLIEDVQGKRELELRTARLSESLRAAQLLGLQAQINPHFLFNTLNTIARTALFEGASETTELIHSLAHVFRYMLQETTATVTIADEIQIVEEYVKLQRNRFHERLRFSLTVDDAALPVSVPALTVQPLVENAIRHGIEPQEEGGEVTVTCTREAGRLTIVIADTGVGMPIQEVPEQGPNTHIGLHNVKTRLELLHGDELLFVLVSKPGTGTTVTISFPDKPMR